MSITNTITPDSEALYSVLITTKNDDNTQRRDFLNRQVDKACQTETTLFKSEKESDGSMLDDYDLITKGDFSYFFKKEDKPVLEEFLSCQDKLKQIDRAFLKSAIEGDLTAYSTDEINKQHKYIFDEIIEPLSDTLEAIKNIEPKPRLLLSVKLTNIIAGVIVALITASMFLLPVLFPTCFLTGTISYGVLVFLNREGTFTLTLSGHLLMSIPMDCEQA